MVNLKLNRTVTIGDSLTVTTEEAMELARRIHRVVGGFDKELAGTRPTPRVPEALRTMPDPSEAFVTLVTGVHPRCKVQQLEQAIATHPEASYNYARSQNGRFVLGEDAILNSEYRGRYLDMLLAL